MSNDSSVMSYQFTFHGYAQAPIVSDHDFRFRLFCVQSLGCLANMNLLYLKNIPHHSSSLLHVFVLMSVLAYNAEMKSVC